MDQLHQLLAPVRAMIDPFLAALPFPVPGLPGAGAVGQVVGQHAAEAASAICRSLGC